MRGCPAKLALLLAGVLLGACDSSAGHKSPTSYGAYSTSYLQHSANTRDSVLCVDKNISGEYWAITKGYAQNGDRFVAKDKSVLNGEECTFTGRNLRNHFAGVQDPDTLRVQWEESPSIH